MVRRRTTTRRRPFSRWSVSPIFFIFFSFYFLSCSSLLTGDTINPTQKLRDGQTLISAGKKFELGFFSPGGASSTSNKRYVGIWYHGLSPYSPPTVVWVANRDKPLVTKTGYLEIGEDGNLMVWDGERIWSTDVPKPMTNNTTAKLLDSGNLILSGAGEGGVENKIHDPIWQSFTDKSADTFLPGMKMDRTKVLRSWANEHDPSPGNFTFEIYQEDRHTFEIKNESIIYWRSGSSAGFTTSDQMPENVAYMLLNFSMTSTKATQNNSSDHIIIPNPVPKYVYNNTSLVMHPSGQIRFYKLSENLIWDLVWWEPRDNCSVHNVCGVYGSCNRTNKPLCKCLPGFQPISLEDWNSGQFSQGCNKKTAECGKETEFLNLTVRKVSNPDTTPKAEEEEECKGNCLSNCLCKAYSYKNNSRREASNTSCWLWMEVDLKDIQEDSSNQSHHIYVRVSPSDLVGADPAYSSHNKEASSLLIVVTVATGIVITCTIMFICYLRRRRRRMAKRKVHRGNIQQNSTFHFDESDNHAKEIDSNQFGEDDKKGIDVPFLNFETIVAATEDFSNLNKLGQGGFGPVYKGKLPGGQEIAVKRLSRCSGQGLDEFKTEVLLIAKLQHRNLVRLLGYSIKGDEKMLLYEFMPNKSLDSFIFDRTRCLLLNWEKRFNIIMGIARGLLYLHQDSRLRIIHRDLKTSNILLDEEMNPKISDFGLARIVGGNDTEANTNRVVGTYGYMSPEYALDGLFSVKSDVFSFGVVLLEIISGKKSTGFYQSENSLNLLGYAWTLWREDKVLDLMDKSLRETCNACDVSNCINVGLLCVQEEADDRPTMSNVLFMLGSETATLPNPQQPAFFGKRCPSSIASSSSRPESYSTNEMSITVEQGR